MKPIRVVQMGLGAVGCGIAQTALGRSHLQVVGAIDLDPAKVGRDLGKILGTDDSLGNPGDGFASRRTGITVSRRCIASHGLAHTGCGRSTQGNCGGRLQCGEHVRGIGIPLAAPPCVSAEIDAKARSARDYSWNWRHPGFIMDTLVLVATAVCSDVRRIASTRVVAARERRLALQQKIGSGMEEADFRQLAAGARLGTWACGNLSHSLPPALGGRYEIRRRTSSRCAQKRMSRPNTSTLPPGKWPESTRPSRIERGA